MSRGVLIIDNGGHTIKTGVSSEPASAVRIVQNAVVRSKGDKKQYIGPEFSQCRDYASLSWRLPLEKGYLTDWDIQKAVWDSILSKEGLNIDPPETSLIITEPAFNFSSIQEKYDQLIFEEYEFESYYRSCPAALTPHGSLFHMQNEPMLPPPECSLIVDSGFSFTHIIPILDHSVVWPSVRRIDVGGKLLTNHLAQLISFRQWNMLDQTYIVNHAKETCSYVAPSRTQFASDLEICRMKPRRNSILQEYLLPDLSTNRSGRLRLPTDIISDNDQVLYMENERFSVPEILFRPSDIGMEQAGIAETIANSISTLPDDLQGMFWANIGLIGGNTNIPGFELRLLDELRSLAPSDYEVSIYKEENPILTPYTSAHALANSTVFPSLVVSHQEYKESGSNAAFRKFRDWKKLTNTGPVVEKKRVSMAIDNDSELATPPPTKSRKAAASGSARRGAMTKATPEVGKSKAAPRKGGRGRAR